MIKALITTFILVFVVSTAAISSPNGFGKHGGSVSSSSGFEFELVTKRKGDNVQFICYVSDGNPSYLTTGRLFLNVVCPNGRTIELEATPSSSHFTASTKIQQRGAFQVQQTYAPDVGPVAVASTFKGI